jgi:hypothetical protein
MEIMDHLKSDSPANYPPSLPFTIENMWLRIEPDFAAKKIIGEEQLKLLTKQNISNVQLDIGQGVEIKSVIFLLAQIWILLMIKKNYNYKFKTENLLFH